MFLLMNEINLILIFLFISYKKILLEITQDKQSCLNFLQSQGVIPIHKKCPGPLFKGSRMQICGCEMVPKNVNDYKGGVGRLTKFQHKMTFTKSKTSKFLFAIIQGYRIQT